MIDYLCVDIILYYITADGLYFCERVVHGAPWW